MRFANESYFFYDKSNLIKQAFFTEIKKLPTIYGSISYFDKKGSNEAAQIILLNNTLNFLALKNTIKNSLQSVS